MNPRLVPLVSLYRSSERLFESSLAGLSREQGLTRLGGTGNPLLWIAAHLATSRYGLGFMLGLDCPRPWGERFTRGSEVGDLAAITGAEEILSAWTGINGALASRLAELGDDELDAPAPRNFPIEDKSVLGALGFLAYHEAYHVGQMALIRKALGLGGLVG